jgi:chromosomal replication initiator protein
MDLEKLWQSTLGEMEIQLTKANFSMWLRDSRLIDRKEGTLYVALPSVFAKNWIEDKYQKNILGILRNTDSSIKKLEFVINPQNAAPQKETLDSKEMSKLETAELDFSKADPETGLNPKYTISSFVSGPSNELALTAAKAICENIGKYNPFFIYGGVGLGKTHLIQAVGNEILGKYQKKVRVKYVHSEQYTREVVWSLRNDRIESVKKKYRDADVLIIDDIQFIGGKEKTEEEFFHTFNALYENNKQIIISSDRPPQSLPTLEERLRSRFEGGFVADIGYPEYEMRIAIIRSKLSESNKSLSDEVVDLLARRLRKNIREMEGILKKLVFIQDQKGTDVTKEIAEEIIDKSTKNPSKRINDSQILKAVAEFFNVSIEDLVSHNRRKEVVEPRQIAMYLLREISELSYPYIGEKMGRDHTTAIHSYEKINNEVTRNPLLNQKILNIKDIIYKS